MASKMWKLFILQTINAGIILLVVNIKIESVTQWVSDFPIFTGEYNDIDPKWYAAVGATLVFYMILNIVTPHISYIIFYCFFLSCKRCWDSRGNTVTRQKTKKDFLNLYVGPEFDLGIRYSQTLATVLVVMIYSSGIPILYLTVFLFFLITYYVDKILVLRFYQKPPKIDIYISRVYNYIIFFSILIHLGFSIWMYGNKYILVDSSSTFMNNIVKLFKEYISVFGDNSFKKEIIMKITLPHNIILLAFLVFLVVCLILKLTIYNFVKSLFCCSGKTHVKKISELDLYEGKYNFNYSITLQSYLFNLSDEKGSIY